MAVNIDQCRDFIDRFLPATGFAGLDKTERAVANFYSRYLSSGDGDCLKSGRYAVKYLDYDGSLNEKGHASKIFGPERF